MMRWKEELVSKRWSNPTRTTARLGLGPAGGGSLRLGVLLLRLFEQGALLPEVHQEVRDRETQSGPRRLIVRLEDDPLRAFVNGFLHEHKESAHIDIFPLGIARGRTGAPDDNTVVLVESKWINVVRHEHIYHLLGDGELEAHRAADAGSDSGRRLMDSTLFVGARENSRHMARGRDQNLRFMSVLLRNVDSAIQKSRSLNPCREGDECE